MIDTNLLELFIQKSGMRRNHIADHLGVTPFTFAKKLRNQAEFKASEIAKLCEILKINSSLLREAIFFPVMVDCKSTVDRRILSIWTFMLARCYDPKHHSFSYYGGRGVVVCEEWRNDFLAFHDWAMEHGYREDLTLDRINPDGNYEPSNCRWATWEEQAANKRPRT